MPSIVGGLDIHRKQITFDYVDLDTGEVQCRQIASADREHFRSWLAGRFARPEDVAFAVEACTGWRYAAAELAAGITAHLAETADTATARGKKKRAKTDRADARLSAGPAASCPSSATTPSPWRERRGLKSRREAQRGRAPSSSR
jgi:transposase